MGKVKRKNRTGGGNGGGSPLDISGRSSSGSKGTLLLRVDKTQQLDAAENSGARRTFRVEPPKDLLERLNALLLQIAAANTKLEAEVAADPAKVDIENVSSEDAQYIEMDLGLGVFDMKPKQGGANGIVIGARADASSSDSDSDAPDRPAQRVIISPSSIAARQGPKPRIEMLGATASGSASGSGSDSDEDMNQTTY